MSTHYMTRVVPFEGLLHGKRFINKSQMGGGGLVVYRGRRWLPRQRGGAFSEKLINMIKSPLSGILEKLSPRYIRTAVKTVRGIARDPKAAAVKFGSNIVKEGLDNISQTIFGGKKKSGSQLVGDIFMGAIQKTANQMTAEGNISRKRKAATPGGGGNTDNKKRKRKAVISTKVKRGMNNIFSLTKK